MHYNLNFELSNTEGEIIAELIVAQVWNMDYCTCLVQGLVKHFSDRRDVHTYAHEGVHIYEVMIKVAREETCPPLPPHPLDPPLCTSFEVTIREIPLFSTFPFLISLIIVP